MTLPYRPKPYYTHRQAMGAETDCGACHEGRVMCPFCKGEEAVPVPLVLSHRLEEDWAPCPHCHGQGVWMCECADERDYENWCHAYEEKWSAGPGGWLAEERKAA